MTVDPATSKYQFDQGGETYHFCSAGCQGKFASAPEQYLQTAMKLQQPVISEGTNYTCPMHPQIRQA
ncbi:MAG: cation translocating P-type ATPase, partial [Tardiphaga sp.]|nr:cation translocating P-type ATPase [Tardiphaga sp.]